MIRVVVGGIIVKDGGRRIAAITGEGIDVGLSDDLQFAAIRDPKLVVI